MPLDFSKINARSTADSVVNPRELFSILPGKDPKYSYLRDVQAEVLDQWFGRRMAKDLQLKMNTGGGKTVVGLLILKSCLNENMGPAVYVAPTPYLAMQVRTEAGALGIAVDEDPRSLAVRRGRTILVTTIKVLLNGMSKFGVGNQGSRIAIGSLVLDDAHACLSTAEEQFTLTVEASHDVYSLLFALFRADLEAQSSSTALDVEQHEPGRRMIVPFWAWLNKINDVESILHYARADDEIKFAWPLLRESLKQCRCVFGDGRVEISPKCLPIGAVPSFTQVQRRIFMSATFADDSVLITHFDADPDGIAAAVTPGNASDIGDRMILVPQELDPRVSDDEIKQLLSTKAQSVNVVVLVPSHRRASYWSDVAASTLGADDLAAGVAELRGGHVGLVVLVNKYDGIDLPHDACRVLVIDGLPDAQRAIDKIEQALLHGTSLEMGRSIQLIEQGMGRGVRANDDYCVVLLMGRTLTGHLFSRNGISRFTPATKAQFELSEEIGDQVRGKGIDAIAGAMDYCISRHADWIKAAKSALLHVAYPAQGSSVRIAIARRRAFDAASLNDYSTAAAVIQAEVNDCGEAELKGWLRAELSEYTHPTDPSNAQQVLQAALRENRQVVRPLAGISYERLPSAAGEQAITSLSNIKNEFAGSNDLIVKANAIAADIEFRLSSYKNFHRALVDMASILGFAAQQPESDYGTGPDVLWSVGALRYFVVECKNEATTETVNKKDCNQLAGSVNWFVRKYDATCTGIPILVHPSCVFERAATPPAGTRIITKEDLPKLRGAFLSYCTAVGTLLDGGQPSDVARLLISLHLVPPMIVEKYSTAASSR